VADHPRGAPRSLRLSRAIQPTLPFLIPSSAGSVAGIISSSSVHINERAGYSSDRQPLKRSNVMIKCSACGTPLYDINEPCPNCLPGMAWRPPTIRLPIKQHSADTKPLRCSCGERIKRDHLRFEGLCFNCGQPV